MTANYYYYSIPNEFFMLALTDGFLNLIDFIWLVFMA